MKAVALLNLTVSMW